MVVVRPLSSSIFDLFTTTNSNLINNIETRTRIVNHILVAFDICMKIKYQTKPAQKLNFRKAESNYLKPKVLNFTQEFLNSNPMKHSVDTNWKNIHHSLCTIMDTTEPWKLSTKSETLHEYVLESSEVREKDINSTVEQGNTRMLYIGIMFVSVAMHGLKW